MYKRQVLSPTPVPATVDYDLWCGPAAKTPLMRRQLHYEWHWFWATGNGEMGNNGIHVTDVCRWGLGQHRPPPRALSIGGRFAFADGGETPNTQVVILDYQPAPILCELRNVRQTPGSDSGGKYRGRNGGVVIDCEDGFLAGDSSRVALHDPAGKLIREFKAEAAPDALEVAHLSNFFAAVRSRRRDGLAAEAAEGHLSVTCCHMANISHRIGQAARPEAIEEAIRGRPEWADAFARSREHLRQNGVDLGQTPAVLGPWVTLDPVTDRFVEGFAEQANRLAGREYRPPFVVPSLS